MADSMCCREPSPSEPDTNESSSSGAAPDRTTSTEDPSAISPADSAAENVAMPHDVGGNDETSPKDLTGAARWWADGTVRRVYND